MNNKVQITQKDLEVHLKEQIGFLKKSAQAYDDGENSEGKRLAICIRLLVHDTNNQTSLLQHLNKKDILFHDTSLDYNIKISRSMLGFNPEKTPLTLLQIQDGNSIKPMFIPHLDEGIIRAENKKLPFEKWWKMTICRDSEDNEFSREDIVLWVANQDGGAHVDKGLDEVYAKLSRANSMGWKVLMKNGEVQECYDGPQLPIIRQISYEILKTLQDEFSENFFN